MRLIRNQSLFTTEIDNDLVMMDAEQGFYFSLNETGKTIWELLATPCSYNEIRDALMAKYQITESQCTSDIHPFIEEMIKHQLIEKLEH